MPISVLYDGHVFIFHTVFPYWLSIAAIMKLSSLKSHIFVILYFYRSKVQHESHWAKIKLAAGLCSFPGAQRQNPFPCSLRLLAILNSCGCRTWVHVSSLAFSQGLFPAASFLGSWPSFPTFKARN